MRRFDEAREMSAPGSQAAAALARDEPVEDPRAIEETSRIEAERAAEEDDPTAAKGVNGETLSDEDQLLVEQLKQRDAEVRAHEQAHVSAGGGHITSGPSYSYQSGPDGKRYAIGGEVGIDTSMKAGDPDGNLAKARAIIRAAMAPAEPSSQDVRVAASARAMESQALQEIRELQVKEYEQVMSTTGSIDRAPTSTGATTAQTASTAENGEAASESATPQNPGISSGQARLAQRIAALFSTPVETGLSQQA